MVKEGSVIAVIPYLKLLYFGASESKYQIILSGSAVKAGESIELFLLCELTALSKSSYWNERSLRYKVLLIIGCYC